MIKNNTENNVENKAEKDIKNKAEHKNKIKNKVEIENKDSIITKNIKCSLCMANALPFKTFKVKKYYLCQNCGAVLLGHDYYLSAEAEKARYLAHQNNVNDAGYQKFVAPIVNAVKAGFGCADKGLDFGCGPGPVISKLLKDEDYDIRLYDPLFCNDAEALCSVYDYIVCCEVIEHFAKPAEEFNKLRSLLKDGGKLFCMTYIYDSSIDFDNWHYKNDTTHIIFYSIKTLEWIKSNFNFSRIKIDGRLIELMV